MVAARAVFVSGVDARSGRCGGPKGMMVSGKDESGFGVEEMEEEKRMEEGRRWL